MLTTPLTDMLGIRHPIVQGGMAWVATWELALAVSEAGALGIYGAGNAPPDLVRDQVQQIKQRTDRPFGLNVPLFSPFVDEVLSICVDEHVPIVTTGAGNPAPYMDMLKSAGIMVIPVVASAALAKRLERAGADAVIAEGAESGGHIGEVNTLALVPAVVDAVEIPVVAAGGIADGRGLAAALALGASGVQMGTRFICTAECIAHANYKQAVVRASERSTIVTGMSVGHPVRCIKNPMAREFEELEQSGASDEEIFAFGTGRLRKAVIEGDVSKGSLMAGQAAGLIHDVVPVRELVERVTRQAEETLVTLGRRCQEGAS